MIDMPAMGATNWPPPSYDPQTGLFYFNRTTGYGIAYLYDTSTNRGIRRRRRHFDTGSAHSRWTHTGSVKWKHAHGREGGGDERGVYPPPVNCVHRRFRGWWRSTRDGQAFNGTGADAGRQQRPSSWMLDGAIPDRRRGRCICAHGGR